MPVENSLQIKAEDISILKERMEFGLQQGFQYISFKATEAIIEADQIFCIKTKELAEDFCWNPKGELPADQGFRLFPLYNAFNDRLKEIAASNTMPSMTTLNVDGIERVDPSLGRRAGNFEHLGKTLDRIGPWDSYLSNRLIDGIQQNNSHFQISYPVTVYGEPLGVTYHFHRNELNNYSLRNFEILRPAAVSAKIKRFEDEMTEFDWNQESYNNYKGYKRHQAQSATTNLMQTFPVRDNFPLTVEQACYLFVDRQVFIQVPGEPANPEKAWFRLDFSQKDNDGNAMLLRAEPQTKEQDKKDAILRFLNEPEHPGERLTRRR